MAAADESIRPHEIIVDVLMEILVRLPGKSLMRFKSVSKYWYSLITHPVFVDRHHTRSYVRPGGVVLVHIPMTDWDTYPTSWDRRFMMIDPTTKNPSNRASVHEISALPGAIKQKTNIVNGLICFYSRTYNGGYVSIYNFTTRENLPLPPPPLRTSIVERKYHLGFDPVNKVYKVLHYWFSESTRDEHCEVLTLGGGGCCENRWRSIEKSRATPCIWDDPVLCNDGVLYWYFNGSNTMKQMIVTFSVEHEQFDFINHPQEEMHFDDGGMYLCLLRGHLLLVGIYRGDTYLSSNEDTQDYNKITLWRLMDRKGPIWKKEVVMHPFRDCYSELECSNFGLVSLVRRSPVQNHIIIDCYMLSTGKRRELVINNAQGLLEPGAEFEPIKLVENIMPLKTIDRRDMVLLAL